MRNEKPQAQESGFDHTLNALREGYLFIQNRRKSFQSNIFITRLFGKRTICMSGKAAAELFYNETYFKRHSAAPRRAVKTIFGKKSVQTLDDLEHRHRKEMFMSLMTDESLKRLEKIARKNWTDAISTWESKYRIHLYDELKPLLFTIACDWAGVPLQEVNVKQTSERFAHLFESPAKIGLEHRRGRRSRKKLNQWASTLITKTREGKLHVNSDCALYKIALHRDLQNELLDVKVAAVELINILRPIVAVSIYINFIALALIQHPTEHEKITNGNEINVMNFVQEVRRFYPFFPFLAAKVRQTFTWNAYTFKKGNLTLLDIYGTNHDSDLWSRPDQFNPDRFQKWEEDSFSLIPQGGGDYWNDHRCPGEWITLKLMKVATEFLANKLSFNVPKQDLSYSMVQIPTIPKNRIILTNIRKS